MTRTPLYFHASSGTEVGGADKVGVAMTARVIVLFDNLRKAKKIYINVF